MENLPLGFTSKCKQKYSYKRLLALHPTEKRTYSDAFRFPSCCSCYVKFDDLLGRNNFRKIDQQINVIDTHDQDLLSPVSGTSALSPSSSSSSTLSSSSDNVSLNILMETASTTESHRLDTTYYPQINQTFD